MSNKTPEEIPSTQSSLYNTMTRESGYYWVKVGGGSRGWEPAQWIDEKKQWLILGDQFPVLNSEMSEIDEVRIVRKPTE